MRSIFLVIANVFAALSAAAQTPASRAAPDSGTVTIPAGTSVRTELDRSLWTRTPKQGDRIYLRTSYPVVVNNAVAIPAGTYVDATLDSFDSRDWPSRAVTVKMHLMRLTFENGYVLTTTDSVDGRSPDDSDGRSDASRADLLGVVGTTNVAMEAGSPLTLLTRAPLTLSGTRVSPYAHMGSTGPRVPRTSAVGTTECFYPGSPATPDIIIPGSPGTPGVGEIPGMPPTPPTTVPGMPGTPAYWYRCH
jgi:hypothetical protein